MEILTLLISVLGSNGVLLLLVKRYFDRKDKREAEEKAAKEQATQKEREEMKSLMDKLKVSLETLRLLAYSRMSEETERLLTKGFATPTERRVLDEMYINYKAHGWNGDMEARLSRVYALRTDHAMKDTALLKKLLAQEEELNSQT